MSSQFYVTDLQKSDSNLEAGLYQFIVTFADQSKCRAFYSKNPDWKITSVNRLLNTPCPICRKDYYCNCMDRLKLEIDREIHDSGLMTD